MIYTSNATTSTMRRAAILVTLAVVLAGCTGEGSLDRTIDSVESVPVGGARDSGEFWMVYVSGTETQSPRPEFTCTLMPPDYEVDVDSATLSYAPESYDVPDTVRVVVAFSHFRKDECYQAWGLEADPAGEVRREMGGYGTLRLRIHDDGSLDVDGTAIPLGEAAVVTYEGNDGSGTRWNGSFRVENLGAWARADIEEIR